MDHLSHELRTPLVIIQASLAPLNRSDLPETQREQIIERIQRQLDRLGDIQNIVQRIVVPQKYLPEPLRVDSAIEGIIADLRKKCSHRQVALLTELEAIQTDIIDHHTQETERYATRKPFDFNAGGKGLELMYLKILSEGGAFDISFKSHRCYFLNTQLDQCRGNLSSCPYESELEGCKKSGGTIFSVLFHRPPQQQDKK